FLARYSHLCNGLSPDDSRSAGLCSLTLMDLTWGGELEDVAVFSLLGFLSGAWSESRGVEGEDWSNPMVILSPRKRVCGPVISCHVRRTHALRSVPSLKEEGSPLGRQCLPDLLLQPDLPSASLKRRTFSMKKSEVVTNEVAEWIKAGIVRPVRNLEAYVDDMVIKSKHEKMLLADIAETFNNLKKINMKLNPKKCSFVVEEGKFLGYMVTSKGIKANPKKTKALADLQSPRTLKKMQSLSGKLAALNRFLAKSVERSLPFFNTLKNITKENKHEY
nr:reverse transcriptase domain-containing protein [Tanacetum cinerariifolium]